MSFDIKSARPIQAKFDMSTAKPVDQKKSIFPKTQIDQGGGDTFENVIEDTIAKTGQDLTAIPAHFFNQMALNYPRAITNKYTPFEYPEETNAPAAGVAAKTAGLVGAIKNPVFSRMKPGASFLQRAGQGAIAGAAYSPEDPMDLGARAQQAAIAGIAAPVAEGAFKVAKNVPKIPEFVKYGTFDLSPENLTNKAEKLTTEILQPSKNELARSLEQGKQLPAVKQVSRIAKPVKTYTDFKSHINDVVKDTFDERNLKLSSNNKKVGNDYIKRLENYIGEQKKLGQSTESEISQMQDVLERERQHFSSNSMDRLTAQKRKEYLQDLTDSLLQKSEHGDVIDTQPARNRALNELRKGLKEAVEDGDKSIAELNSRYAGLKRAKELISGQEALSKKAVPESIPQKALRFITKPHDIPGDVARGVLEKQSGLASKTKKIQQLMERANRS